MRSTVSSALVFALLALLAAFTACNGGSAPAVDIKDFDTARFAMTQTSTTGGDESQITGEGVIDNRKQALTITYGSDPGGQVIAVGRTIYTYAQGEQRWTSTTEPVDGQVGFGRPYWPKFWLDAVRIEELGQQTLLGAETSGYRLFFGLEEVGRRLQAGATEPVDVRQAEVEVWVDNGSRYAVQLTFRLELAFGAQTTKLEIISTFSDFGVEVDIEAPEDVSPSP